jgi:hypothetical protein
MKSDSQSMISGSDGGSGSAVTGEQQHKQQLRHELLCIESATLQTATLPMFGCPWPSDAYTAFNTSVPAVCWTVLAVPGAWHDV